MKLTIKTLQQKVIQLEVEPSVTILGLKEKLQETQGFEVPFQKIIYSGKILNDEQTIESLNVKETDFMVVMVTKSKPAASSSGATPSKATPVTVTNERKSPDRPNPPTTTTTENVQPPSTTVEPSDSEFVTGKSFEMAVNNMVEMGFPKEEVIRAMRAAFNNPDRAVEYLMNGIPSSAEPSSTADPIVEPNSPSSTPAVTDPENLFSLAQQHVQNSQRSPQVSPSAGLDLSSLANNPQMGQLRQMIQANPQLLQPLIQQMAGSNPQLMQFIQSHPEEFLSMFLGGGNFAEEGEEGGPTQRMSSIPLTDEEKSAIDRLVALGFDRMQAIEAFLACDKNEMLAANYLFDSQFN